MRGVEQAGSDLGRGQCDSDFGRLVLPLLPPVQLDNIFLADAHALKPLAKLQRHVPVMTAMTLKHAAIT